MKKATMQDIADHLGISKMTVSKVFKGDSDISVQTREKILKTAINLGYSYNKNKNYFFSVLAPEVFLDTNEEFYTGLYKRFNEVASLKNIILTLNVVKKNDEKNFFESLQYINCDAIIVLGQFPKKRILELKAMFDKPIICIDFYYRNLGIDTVTSNNFSASYNITSYLIENGHTKIGFVGALNSTTSINDRYFGYYKALLENEIQIDEKYIFSDRRESDNALEIKLHKDLPTAFVCNNDHTAYLLIEKLKELGYKVPEDISVVGFDDVIYSSICDPKITTMRVPRKLMAETSLDILLRRLQNPKVEVRNTNIECKMIERDSVKMKN